MSKHGLANKIKWKSVQTKQRPVLTIEQQLSNAQRIVTEAYEETDKVREVCDHVQAELAALLTAVQSVVENARIANVASQGGPFMVVDVAEWEALLAALPTTPTPPPN